MNNTTQTNDGYFSQCVEDIKNKIPSDWEYASSPNDAAPSYIYNNLQIFIDHPDPSRREDKDWTRYSVWNDDQDVLLQTDSFDECIKFIEQNNK